MPSGAGKEDEVGKMTDVSAIVPVPLLHAIFAILLVSGKTLRTVAASCDTVSTESAPPSPVGGFAVPQLIVLLPDQAQSVLRGDVLLYSQGVWHGGQGQYRRWVDQAAFWRPLQSKRGRSEGWKPNRACENRHSLDHRK